MKNFNSGHCPVCDEKLHINRLSCPQCKAEYPIDEELSAFDYLSEEQKHFLITFLKCKGNIKALEAELGISYPTVNKRFDELLVALNLKEKTTIKKESIDMSVFGELDRGSTKASDIIKIKLFDNGGSVTITLPKGGTCYIAIAENGNAFVSDKLPGQTVYFSVFDIIVNFLRANGGKAPKGIGRTDKVGYGKCGSETVMYQIATLYYGKKTGESTFDPLFVLAAILEWGEIAENGWGYLKLIK